MPILKIGQSTYNNVVQPVVFIQGIATRDAEDKPINGTDHATASIAAGDGKDGLPLYITLNGWKSGAEMIRKIRKGDSILAIGRYKTRSYNEKIYNDLDVDFIIKHGAGFEEEDFGLPDELPDPTQNVPLDKTAASVRTAEQFAKYMKEQKEKPAPEEFELLDDEEGLPF